MNVLLDTHVVLWWLDDSPALAAPARRVIADPTNLVHVSAAVAWEIEIKRSLGKLDAPPDLEGAIEDAGFEPLPIAIAHAVLAGSLPRHHRDPFDRLLVAQGQLEHMTVVTADTRFTLYDVDVVGARVGDG